jgi:NADH dehydrogenase [ubiquinone] 1 alpha subcomplex assembly factor 5
MRAPRFGQKIEGLPARGAKAAVFANNHPTARAPRRQRKRNYGAGDIHDCLHHAYLSRDQREGTSGMMDAPIFDRRLRRTRFARQSAADSQDDWLLERMATELVDRLSDISIRFDRVLIMGLYSIDLARQLRTNGIICDLGSASSDVVCDEDRIAFCDESFDMVINCGGLDTVDDIPGALILTRRILKPGGLFLGAMMGAGSLPLLRNCVAQGDADAGIAVARFHPQIDVRAAGDLLARAGFALPVADQDRIDARYTDFDKLIGDVRANGMTNVLLQRRPLSRKAVDAAKKHFELMKGADGRSNETYQPIFLCGWNPTAFDQMPSGPVRQGRATRG